MVFGQFNLIFFRFSWFNQQLFDLEVIEKRSEITDGCLNDFEIAGFWFESWSFALRTSNVDEGSVKLRFSLSFVRIFSRSAFLPLKVRCLVPIPAKFVSFRRIVEFRGLWAIKISIKIRFEPNSSINFQFSRPKLA